MTGEFWPSAIAAALFAIHPLRPSRWPGGRAEGRLKRAVLHATLVAYCGHVRRPFSLLRYLAVAVFFALGLMAKPTLVTVPFVLLLLDYWPLGRFDLAAEAQRQNGPSARRAAS